VTTESSLTRSIPTQEPRFGARATSLAAHRVSKRRENRPGFRAGETPGRAQRVSKRRENRRRLIPLGKTDTVRFARVGRFFPESASCFQSRPILERVGRFWNDWALFGTSRWTAPRLLPVPGRGESLPWRQGPPLAAFLRAQSSFRIVPVPRLLANIELLLLPNRSTKKVSSASFLLSPLTTMVMVFVV